MSGFEKTSLVAKPSLWLTNTSGAEASAVVASLKVGHAARVIVQGSPKASETATADELKRMGMVGLYDAEPIEAFS